MKMGINNTMSRAKCAVFLLGIIVLSVAMASRAEAARTSLSSVASELVSSIAASKSKKVAILDLTDIQGRLTALGRFLSEELAAKVGQQKHSFALIDRVSLESLLKEHALSLSGITQPENAKKLGNIAGVDALVVGSYTSFGESYRILVKILDTETAERLGSASANVPKTSALRDLSKVRIQSPLEEVNGNSASTQGTASTMGNSTSPKGYQFDTGDIRGKIQSIGMQGNIATVTIMIENYNEKPVWIFVLDRDNQPAATLTDNLGNSCRAKDVSGAGYHYHAESPDDGGRYDQWTGIKTGRHIYATIQYKCAHPLKGTTATAVTVLGLVAKEGEPHRVSFGVSRIKLPQKHE